MAMSLRTVHGVFKHLQVAGKGAFSLHFKRYLLSEAYSCNEAWKKYLQDPLLNQVSFHDYANQIHDQLDKTNRVSAVDMNVLAHHFHQMEEDDVEFVDDILYGFNRCQASYNRSDSTTHAIVKGFLSTNNGNHLVTMLMDRLNYGLFPNHYTLNLLMDSFIKKADFHNAAKVAYSLMLQEDFSNPISAFLSLYSTVQHLLSSNIDELAPPPKEQSDGEENWIKVDYIVFPYYDDHFDIKDERFLLGKTLLMLGNVKSVDVPKDIRSSLKLIGLGLYHKFPKGLALLKDILNSVEGCISQQALDYFSASLEKVEARDPNEPEVELTLRTVDDVIHRLLPTIEEKARYQTEFSELKDQLLSQNKVQTDFDLGKLTTEFVTANVSKFEEQDISTQENLFNIWTEERKKELEVQIAAFKKTARIEEMKKQIKELQEQEEMLTYFDYEEKIRLHFVEEDRATDKNLTISK